MHNKSNEVREESLVLGDYRQTLTVARSLARAGQHVVLGSEKAHPVFARYSRATAAWWRYPDPALRENEFVQALQGYLAAHPGVRWIFPVGEAQLLALARHAKDLPAQASVVKAEAATIELCLDKPGLFAQATACEIPVASFFSVSHYDALVATLDELGYPSIVKPVSAFSTVHGRKALILTSDDDRKRALKQWPAGNSVLIVQRYVRGWRHNCHFLADEGRILAYFEQRVLRTDRSDGTGYGVDSVSVAPSPQLRGHCERLLGRLRYSGVGCAQFLVDRDAVCASFLEINPRLDATCALPFYCGYDFPAMAVEYARYRRGERPAPPSNHSSYATQRRGIWFLGDLKGWSRELRRGQLTLGRSAQWLVSALGSLLAADFHLTWSWQDPLPTFYIAGRWALSPLWKLFGIPE